MIQRERTRKTVRMLDDIYKTAVVLNTTPVVSKKCVMRHSHYADAKKGKPIGLLSYTIEIE